MMYKHRCRSCDTEFIAEDTEEFEFCESCSGKLESCPYIGPPMWELAKHKTHFIAMDVLFNKVAASV